MLSRTGISEGLDTQVQGTNDDAQISKLSCSRAGYFKDEYIQYFVRKPVKRSPLINRGYYSRYAALRQLLLAFLDATRRKGQESQVLVLGAGFDTTWFQLQDTGQAPFRYLELDFKQVTQKKTAIIHTQPALWSKVCAAHTARAAHSTQPPAAAPVSATTPQTSSHTSDQPSPAQPAAAQPPHPSQPAQLSQPTADTPPAPSTQHTAPPATQAPQIPSLFAHRLTHHHTPLSPPAPTPEGVVIDTHSGELLSDGYSVLSADLRDATAVQTALERAHFSPTAPTYILSECVLVYMEPQATNTLLSWLASYFQHAAVVIYEQIKPEDAFGRQMMSNLELRGCPLRGLMATPSLEHHCRRLQSCGWPVTRAWDMDSIYKWHLDPADRKRVEGLEVFDEFEEWHLIQEHYCISVGLKGCSQELMDKLTFGAQGCVTG